MINLPELGIGSRDPTSSPIVDEVKACIASEHLSFHMPGHKGGRGAPPLALDLIGSKTFWADVSEVGDFDYLHDPHGNLLRSMRLTSEIFGADHSFFLINGSTAGNIAALLTTVQDGDQIVISRASHRSVFAGITLAGASPVYLMPEYCPSVDSYLGFQPAVLREILQTATGVKAIHLTRPNYYGWCFELSPFVEVAYSRQVPLIIDEAHGSHFAFHPSFPTTSLSQKVDIAVQSIHKTLGSLTQSSIMHLNSRCIQASRLQETLSMIQSSSPSALLLLSLDAAIARMAAEGIALMERAIGFSDKARKRINTIDGLYCYGDELIGLCGLSDFDPTKLVIDFSGLGITGFDAARRLKLDHRIGVELADFRRIVCSVTLADTDEDVSHLVGSLCTIAGDCRGRFDRPAGVATQTSIPHLPRMVLTPRQARRCAERDVAFDKAVGAISAEYVIPYPPGIPILVPGEAIDLELLEYLRALGAAGIRLAGVTDKTMRTLRVINEIARKMPDA